MKKLILFIFTFCVLIPIISCEYDALVGPEEGKPSDIVPIKANVIIAVGGIVYENLDAKIRVKGYNSDDAVQWTKEYNFAGAGDVLEIKKGFHHYRIDLINKWGINDQIDDLSAQEIWDNRANGPLPVTYNLGGSKIAKKLSMYVTSKQINVLDTEADYPTESRVLYAYDEADRLESITYETYNTQTLQFEEMMAEAFIYEGTAVSKIIRTVNGRLYSEYRYEYGEEDKIIEKVYDGLEGTLTIALKADGKVNTKYSFSNGGSFFYDFSTAYKNIISDKTTKYGELCSRGNYTYDQNINPFRHLGYTDFYLKNWSASNKLTQHIDYLACSFPANRVPVSYLYTYDEDGYPVKNITTYQGSPHSPIYHSKIDFYYEE